MYEGPTNPISIDQHTQKYRVSAEETFDQCVSRIARGLSDNSKHEQEFKDILGHQRFLPAGRVQRAIGSELKVTAFNCFVSGTIRDTSEDIFDKVKEAFQTMRRGGGIGYDFSTIRPRGALISTLGSGSSGPVTFMDIFDATCKTVQSAGGRRGAQMGVLRVDHPDIDEFIDAKTVPNEDDVRSASLLTQDESAIEVAKRISLRRQLSAFNVSVGVTNDFMTALENDTKYALKFGGKTYGYRKASDVWDKLMRATWDWAEPGIIFIDRINELNNLYYCETISATNPCGEQPLPPYGACLLGSFALPKYIRLDDNAVFDWEQFRNDIPAVVRSMDNVIDVTTYPLQEQKDEAESKRRMGLGVTGVANAIEVLGYPYGSTEFLNFLKKILNVLANNTYRASVDLAREKGVFPLFDKAKFMGSKQLGSGTYKKDVLEGINTHGIRNSHLTSIAPTGTISLSADNMSSSIEPVFAYSTQREIKEKNGKSTFHKIDDYGVAKFGVRGRRADDIDVKDHVNVLATTQQFIDSSVSKTCNVGDKVTFEEFKNVYQMAWHQGAKGCTTFRAAGKRFGVLKSLDVEEGEACTFDPETGKRTCE